MERTGTKIHSIKFLPLALVRSPATCHNKPKALSEKGDSVMNDKHEAVEQCEETSCKDDLMQGLMALFAQADAAEAAAHDASNED